jgi:1-acyl-sn-glycerol-3-phosphate acyltransferase
VRLYRMLRPVVFLIVRLCWRFRAEGTENLPEAGACIVAANHFHLLDPVIIGAALGRPVRFMAKEELFRNRLAGRLLSILGAFPVKRGKTDVQAVRRSLQVLAEGEVLGIFPEGTRGRAGEIQDAYSGAALLAARCEAPLVPVGLYGTYRPGGRLRMKVGKPFYVNCQVKGRPTSEERSHATGELMEQIGALVEQCKNEGW